MIKLTSTEFDAGTVIHNFDCDFTVTTAGDGLWGCEPGRQVRVTGICVIHTAFDDSINTRVDVTHGSTWDIYTDTAFESAVSGALGFDVGFTEQGMQEDGLASMEV
ncbi:MAG: hypothetical protein EBR82_77140 [Caulobacteraceae bacterium]|nr:hypothetical protein [Caulobacteraceae bacterium]